jgi:predicted protein tyrosine phosphatase
LRLAYFKTQYNNKISPPRGGLNKERGVMEIIIKSVRQVVPVIKKEPKKWNIISIRDSNSEHASHILDAEKDALDILPLYFDDLYEKDAHKGRGLLPQYNQIKEAITWAKDKDDILVQCEGGISRSAALAYIIACSKMHIQKALKVWNTNLHYPNAYIVKIGSVLLDSPEIYELFMKKMMEG